MKRSLLPHPVLLAGLGLIFSIWALVACGPVEPTRSPVGESAHVSFVLDGDTVELADGRRVRYIGINTPETGQRYADEARSLNEALVADRDVWLETDQDIEDDYGRLLAYVWVEDRLVNLELVEQGYATAYMVPPNTRYAQVFARAEEVARSEERGMWISAAERVPVRITGLRYDGPGSDVIAPNGEWIEFSNVGDVAVDLEGYLVRDAGRHVYTFTETLLPPGARLYLYSGRGSASEDPLERYWGLSGEAVWDNTGDSAYLQTPDGALVDCFVYVP